MRIGLVVHGGKPAAIAAADRVRTWAINHKMPCVDIDVWDAAAEAERLRREGGRTGFRRAAAAAVVAGGPGC